MCWLVYIAVVVFLCTAQRHIFGCVWKMDDFCFRFWNCYCGRGQLILPWPEHDAVAFGRTFDCGEYYLLACICVNMAMETHVPSLWQSLLVLLLFSREPGPLQKGERKPKAHKLVEGLGVLYLLIHMWSGFIISFF